MKITLLFICLAIGGIGLEAIGARVKRAGGKKIRIAQAPYYVSLRRNTRHICGGALIGPVHVLTAAHCVWDRTFGRLYDIKVVCGTDRYGRTDFGHTIINIFPHDGFLQGRSACDLAVVRLSSQFAWRIPPDHIALPNAELPYGEYGKLIALKIRTTNSSNPGLQELRVKIRRTNSTLINTEDSERVFYGTMVFPQSISDIDLGGPLVYEGRIVGIASERRHRNACNFVNVLKFKSFIEIFIGNETSSNAEHPSVIRWAPKRRRL